MPYTPRRPGLAMAEGKKRKSEKRGGAELNGGVFLMLRVQSRMQEERPRRTIVSRKSGFSERGASKRVMIEAGPSVRPFPEVCGRVAVLGGTALDKTTLLVGLALRHIQQRRVVLCL